MKTLLIATLLAAALPAQNARLVVSGKSSALSSGSLCDAWSCLPGALALMPGEGIQNLYRTVADAAAQWDRRTLRIEVDPAR